MDGKWRRTPPKRRGASGCVLMARGPIWTPVMRAATQRIALTGAHSRPDTARERYAFAQSRTLGGSLEPQRLVQAVIFMTHFSGDRFAPGRYSWSMTGFAPHTPGSCLALANHHGGRDRGHPSGGRRYGEPPLSSIVPTLDVMRRIPRSTGYWRLRGSVRGDGIGRRSYPYSSTGGDGALKAL
jgi:hypothetical protein